MERGRSKHVNRQEQNIHLIDFMGWLTGDTRRPGRPRTIFGDGGRRATGRRTLIGRRRLEEQYETRRVTGFNSDEIADIRQIFEYYDLDNNKTMDLSELDVALRALGYNPTVDEVEQMTSLMDVDGDKTLDFSEFCMILEHLREMKGEFGELRDAFRCLDHNEDGQIAADDLRKLLTTQGESVSLKEVHDIIKLADPEGTGFIHYDDLIEILKGDVTSRSADEEPTTSQGAVSSLQSTPSWSHGESSQSSLRSHKGKKKKKKVQMDIIGGMVRRVEPVDNLVKALGGPILITSALIITSQTGSRPKSARKKHRWPSVQRVLKYKHHMEAQEVIEEIPLDDVVEHEDERTDLLQTNSRCDVINETAT